MIQVKPRSREEMLQAWRDRAEAVEDQEEPPLPENVRALAEINGWRVLGFGTGFFLTPPPPVPECARLDWIQRRLGQLNKVEDEELTSEHYDEYVSLCREVTEISHTLVRPLRWRNRYVRGWWARLTWRWRRNPFRNASEADVGALLGFFSMCRTMLSVRQVKEDQSRHLITLMK